jgi:HTH-type transcriptional regulator/antitoxin HigA
MIAALESPEIKRLWPIIGKGLSIRTEEDYDRTVELLDQLLDEVGENTAHPLYDFLHVVAALIERYEDAHVKIPDVPARTVLKHFMQEHKLKPSDLPEVGNQSVVSEILRGKRELNTRQIKALGQRFHVSPAVFID